MWESQCEESKQVRINDVETSFSPSVVAHLKNAVSTRQGNPHLLNEVPMMNVTKCWDFSWLL